MSETTKLGSRSRFRVALEIGANVLTLIAIVVLVPTILHQQFSNPPTASRKPVSVPEGSVFRRSQELILEQPTKHSL